MAVAAAAVAVGEVEVVVVVVVVVSTAWCLESGFWCLAKVVVVEGVEEARPPDICSAVESCHCWCRRHWCWPGCGVGPAPTGWVHVCSWAARSRRQDGEGQAGSNNQAQSVPGPSRCGVASHPDKPFPLDNTAVHVLFLFLFRDRIPNPGARHLQGNSSISRAGRLVARRYSKLLM